MFEAEPEDEFHVGDVVRLVRFVVYEEDDAGRPTDWREVDTEDVTEPIPEGVAIGAVGAIEKFGSSETYPIQVKFFMCPERDAEQFSFNWRELEKASV